MPKDDLRRQPDPIKRDMPGTAEPERPAMKLLVEYEEAIGQPLRKLEQPIRLPDSDRAWPWSWSPEQAAAFLAEWERPLYVMNDLLRELAFTPAPSGRLMMYERACSAETRAAIDRIMEVQELPISAIPPVPKGPCTVDLSPAPMFMRPAVFTINHWHFHGIVRNIPENLADQLREIHGRWFAEGMRVFMGLDHGMQSVGEVHASG